MATIVTEVTKNKLTAIAIMRRAGVLAALAGSLSACGTMSTHLPSDNGRILIDADAKGVQAFLDGFNGAITNGKATADKNTAHWELRKKQSREDTVQKYAPSFLGGIFGTQTGVIPSSQEPSEPVQVVGSEVGAIVK
jgi:hypothetical protein